MGMARKLERSTEEGAVEKSYGRPARAWAGRGKGSCCDHCHQPIDADQIEYEIELVVDKHRRIARVHLECYEEWMLLQYPAPDASFIATDESP